MFPFSISLEMVSLNVLARAEAGSDHLGVSARCCSEFGYSFDYFKWENNFSCLSRQIEMRTQSNSIILASIDEIPLKTQALILMTSQCEGIWITRTRDQPRGGSRTPESVDGFWNRQTAVDERAHLLPGDWSAVFTAGFPTINPIKSTITRNPT
jgi:hypothetical protein